MTDQDQHQEENQEENVEFLPFHAINEFMRDDYRLKVVRSTLNAMPALPAEYRTAFDLLTRRLVQVPGFRNSAKAPAAKRIRPTAEAFTKSANLVAVILACWAEAHAELRQQVYDLLVARGWELLPVDADRSALPGFDLDWPEGEDFTTLHSAFQEANPQSEAGADDVSLMVVWLAVRLPYNTGEEDDEHDHEHQHDHTHHHD
jgi:hypothetical protein